LEDSHYGGDLKPLLGTQLPMLLEKIGEIEDLRKDPTHNIKTVLLFRTAVPVLRLSSKGEWPAAAVEEKEIFISGIGEDYGLRNSPPFRRSCGQRPQALA
jgi:hypothetical protein